MDFLQQDHLRVQRPVTSDGIQLVLDEETNQPIYKTFHLPLSAKPYLELRNAKLPKNLQVKIELVKGFVYVPAPPVETEKDKEIEALKAEVAKLKAKKAKNDKESDPQL